MLPWLIPAIALGANLIGRIIDAKERGDQRNEMRGRYDQYIGEATRRVAGLEDMVNRFLSGGTYDPRMEGVGNALGALGSMYSGYAMGGDPRFAQQQEIVNRLVGQPDYTPLEQYTSQQISEGLRDLSGMAGGALIGSSMLGSQAANMVSKLRGGLAQYKNDDWFRRQQAASNILSGLTQQAQGWAGLGMQGYGGQADVFNRLMQNEMQRLGAASGLLGQIVNFYSGLGSMTNPYAQQGQASRPPMLDTDLLRLLVLNAGGRAEG